MHGLVRADRADLVRLLAELTPEEWAAPTALPGWSVHDVAAHAIAYDELGWGGFVRRFGQAPLGLDRANDIGVHADRGLSREQVLERYPRHPGPRGLSTAFGGRLGLTEGLVHQQDIRRALGRPRELPADGLRVVFPFALWALVLPGRRLMKGLRLVPTDLDAHWGSRPAVTGPAEALLMATLGRDTLGELGGPGWATLAARLTGSG